MASAAEQLASSLNLGAFAKATELKKRIWFTLGALVIYRLGTYIPLPGIDPQILAQIFQSQQGGLLAADYAWRGERPRWTGPGFGTCPAMRCWKSWAGAAWGSSTRPARSG